MLILVAVMVVIVAIAVFQAAQGLYSSLVMAFAATVSAVLAFQFYQPLAGLVVDRIPGQAHAAAMLVVFFVSLLVLRTAADKLLPHGAPVGTWPDRVLGGVFGLFTGTILVGMALIVIQMLPVGGKLFSCELYTDSLERTSALSPANPDVYTIEMIKALSSGSLSNDQQTFAKAHDDFLVELFCARNQVEPTSTSDEVKGRVGRVDALPDSLSDVAAYDATNEQSLRNAPEYPLTPQDVDTRVVLVRAGVSDSARDENNWWMLPATHFRLVAREGDSLRGYYPVGYVVAWSETADGAHIGRLPAQWELVTATEGKTAKVGAIAVQRNAVSGKTKLHVDWVYRIPKDAMPAKLVFRRVAEQSIDAVKQGMPSSTEALGKAGQGRPAATPKPAATPAPRK